MYVHDDVNNLRHTPGWIICVCVTDQLLHTYFREHCNSMGLLLHEYGLLPNEQVKNTSSRPAYRGKDRNLHRTRTSQRFTKRRLQGARLPHSPQNGNVYNQDP